jgi:hypothetical protein
LELADGSVGAVVLPNKAGGHRVFSRQTLLCWMPSLMDLADEEFLPMSSIGCFAWRLLDWMRFGCAHPCFFLLFDFKRKRREAQLSVAIMTHVFYIP